MTRVLVVDDNMVAGAIIQKRLQKMLVLAVVDRALDGAAAFAMCQCSRYDAIIMDLDMPHCDGETAMLLIRKRGLNMETPILVNSARESIGSSARGANYAWLRALGATCILQNKRTIGIDANQVREYLDVEKGLGAPPVRACKTSRSFCCGQLGLCISS